MSVEFQVAVIAAGSALLGTLAGGLSQALIARSHAKRANERADLESRRVAYAEALSASARFRFAFGVTLIRLAQRGAGGLAAESRDAMIKEYGPFVEGCAAAWLLASEPVRAEIQALRSWVDDLVLPEDSKPVGNVVVKMKELETSLRLAMGKELAASHGLNGLGSKSPNDGGST
jgi:hypothetical protein